MKVTFLGTGTSQGVPVISCTCPVCTSSDPRDNRLRSSVLIQNDIETLCIDSGTDFRYQMLRAGVTRLNGILYTHEHKDHIAGLDDIRPFNYMQGMVVDLYATTRVQEALHREFSYIFADARYHGLPQVKMHTIANGQAFDTPGFHVKPFLVMHARLPITGYRIGDFTYITDAKTLPPESMDIIAGTKVLVINALQRASHVSHFTLQEALSFAERVGARQTYLTHISHHLGTHQSVSAELPPGVQLAYDGLTLNI